MLNEDHQRCYAAGPKARISNAERTKQHLWQKSFPTCVLATLTPAVLTCPQLRLCGKLRTPPKNILQQQSNFAANFNTCLQKKRKKQNHTWNALSSASEQEFVVVKKNASAAKG